MNIFESESYFSQWRIVNGAPIGYSISNIRSEDKLKERDKKDSLYSEIMDLFSHEDIRDLIRNNNYFKQIDTILDKLDGMIIEELKNIRNRLKLLIKHQNPTQVTKLFKFIMEY